MTRSPVAVCACVVIAIATATADAVEVLTAKELASHCAVLSKDADGADGQYCIRYIQGFIDGAVATDVRVMLNMESQSSTPETFSERAMRTRLIDRSVLRRAAGYAEFCLGDPVPLAAVVSRVVADLDQRTRGLDSSGTARDAVYESLRRNYPCDPA